MRELRTKVRWVPHHIPEFGLEHEMISAALKGKTILGFSVHEYGFCSLQLSDHHALSIETLCRFIGVDGEFFTSADHGRVFGLTEPFDASDSILRRIKGKTIGKVDFREDTGDLILFLDIGRLEIICSSFGYEAYQLNGPGGFIMVVRGGNH